MKMGVLHVNTTRKPPYRSKINIRSPWLADSGFVYNAPVIAIPCREGFTLTLYSTMDAYWRDGGKLIHVGGLEEKPNLILNLANNFSTTGLSGGDFLAAGFEYGTITARKLPDAQRYYVVGSQANSPFLQFSGGWLSDVGFTAYAIIAVSFDSDCLTFTRWSDDSANYSDIVKLARECKSQIIQPRCNQNITILDIPCYLLENAGFVPGDISGVRCQYGSIELFKPDLKKLGF